MTEDKTKDIMENIFTVTNLNIYVRGLLRRDDKLQDIWVKGEISNFTHYNDRHMYFELKDEDSIIHCAMFRSMNKELDFSPEEGMEVLCKGDVSLYLPRGQYQLVVKEMLPEGMGKLYLAYEKLKNKLSEEGLFDKEYKKDIPTIPEKVGIVTSEEGAALRDIVTIIKRRFPNMDILISPTPVQGKEAAPKIVKAIEKLDRKDVDVIIVGRGGGSIEDLWNFNEEEVARAIFKANTPIVSAVGHETDFLISDLVADYRAPTPSAAGEKVAPLKDELLNKIKEQRNRSSTALMNVIEDCKRKLENLIGRPIFRRPEIILEEPIQRLDENKTILENNINRNIREQQQKLKNQLERLRALGPTSTLKRGYSVVTDVNGELVKSVENVEKGEELEIKMIDGKLKTIIKEVIRSQTKKE